jgi:hypothetical protein
MYDVAPGTGSQRTVATVRVVVDSLTFAGAASGADGGATIRTV